MRWQFCKLCALLMICRHTNTRRLLSLIERNRPAISTSPPPTICNLFHLSQYKPWPISFTYFAQIWKAKKKEEMLCLFLFAFFMTFFKRFPELSLSLSKWFFQAEQQYFCIIFFLFSLSTYKSECKVVARKTGKLNWVRYLLIGRTHLKNRTHQPHYVISSTIVPQNLHKHENKHLWSPTHFTSWFSAILFIVKVQNGFF